MAEAVATGKKTKEEKKPRRPRSNLDNSRERSASQESLLQDEIEKAEEHPKMTRARQRTRARFESLLQAAASEGMLNEMEKSKKKRRTKTADSLLSELKSGRHIVKERSRSEEQLLNDNLYREDASPKFKKKRAKDVLLDNQNTKKAELPSEEDVDIKSARKQKKAKSKKRETRQKSDVVGDFVSNDLEDGAGKENIAYEQSPERQKEQDTTSVPKQKKKKKQNKEAAGEIIERALERKRRDDGYLLCIQIHKAGRLKPDINVHHPCIRVHIIDVATGQYVKKSDRTRNVASLYEGKNELVDFVMPMITQPFDFRKQRSMLPCWEDVLLFNEIYSYFLQREEGDPEVIIFFEIIDFLSISSVTRGKMQGAEHGWYKIAWAFLKVVSANGSTNTDKKVRLQLYHPPARLRARNQMPGAIEVFQWWKAAERVTYPSTLYVTVKGIRPPDDLDAATRSMYPIQKERGRVTFEELSNTLEGIDSRKRVSIDKKVQIWDRLPGQANRIPNKLSLILPTGRQGCSVARFSPDGRVLACACAGVDGYPILVYQIPSGTLQGELSGHFGIVYDMSWTSDRELLTASSDGTVRSWDADRCVGNAIKIYPHPSFVYAAKHHPGSQHIIVSGGYDQVIRVWSKTTDNLHGKLLREMPGHNGFVNSIAFQSTGDKMYTADSSGIIIIWNCSLPNTEKKTSSKMSRNEEAIKGWRTLQTVKLEEIRNTPINSIKLHPSGRKLLVHSRDAFIRMLDLRSTAVMKRYLGALNTKEHIRSTTSTCGSFVISGSEDGTVHVWNTETGDPVYDYTDLGYTNAVSDVDFHQHENMVVFCSFGSGHPVLVYVFDIEVQMKANKLNDNSISNEARDSHSLADTSASLLKSKQRPLSYAADGSGIEKEKLRAERVRQKLDTVMNSADFTQNTSVGRAAAFSQFENTRSKSLADTLHTTWGSDFSTYLPTQSPQLKIDHRTASPHASQHFGSSGRMRSQSQNSEVANASISASRYSPVHNPYFGAIEAQLPDSPLTISQLQKSTKPVFSFNAGASQRKKTPQKKKVVALYPYQPNRADELPLEPNDIITVLFEDNDSWWMGELMDGRQGYFPANYVMDQEEDLKEISTTRQDEKSNRNYHSAVVSKDGDLKIISGPEDSEIETRNVAFPPTAMFQSFPEAKERTQSRFDAREFRKKMYRREGHKPLLTLQVKETKAKKRKGQEN